VTAVTQTLGITPPSMRDLGHGYDKYTLLRLNRDEAAPRQMKSSAFVAAKFAVVTTQANMSKP